MDQSIDNPLNTLRQGLSRLAPIPDAEWNHFASLLAIRSCNKGELLVRQGETWPYVGYVLQGVFRYVYLTKSGDEVIKSFACEGMPVSPYSALLQGVPSQLSIEALADAKFFVIEYADYTALYQRHACWQEVGRKTIEQLYIVKERREWQLLLLSARERLIEFRKEFAGLESRIPQYQVAAYLGISPVTLSRIVTKQAAK